MEDFIANRPNWIIATLIGILMGYFLRWTTSFLRYIWKRISEKSYIENEWYSIHQTTQGENDLVVPQIWKIRRAFTGNLEARVYDSEGKKLKGKGILRDERGFEVADILNRAQGTSFQVRIRKGYDADNLVMSGYWIGEDFKGRITVKPIALSKVKIIEEATPLKELSATTKEYLHREGLLLENE